MNISMQYNFARAVPAMALIGSVFAGVVTGGHRFRSHPGCFRWWPAVGEPERQQSE